MSMKTERRFFSIGPERLISVDQIEEARNEIASLRLERNDAIEALARVKLEHQYELERKDKAIRGLQRDVHTYRRKLSGIHKD